MHHVNRSANPEQQKSSNWQHQLVTAWQSRGWLACLLWPVSLLARVYWEITQWIHRRRPAVSMPGAIPWVVVGNVVVGGAGKTPTTMALVRHWQQQGRRPGVVSKGHGRVIPKGFDTPIEVTAHTPAHQSGDEPLLIHQATGAPVAVGPDRLATGQWLLKQHPELDLLICDDGLQDSNLTPTARVIVFDDRGTGNGWMLPAGMLRQPWPLRHVHAGDVVLYTASPSAPLQESQNLPVYTATRQLDEQAINALGIRQSLAELAQSGPATAWAGIARPDRFFSMLQQTGVVLNKTLALEDHQHFDDHLHSKLMNELKWEKVFFTEKDAVKLFPSLQQTKEIASNAWAVPLVMTLPPAFLAELDARLSFAHGSQAA